MLFTSQKLYCPVVSIHTRRELKLTFPIPVYFCNITSYHITQLPASWSQHKCAGQAFVLPLCLSHHLKSTYCLHASTNGIFFSLPT